MSKITGYSDAPYLIREAGEALEAATMGALKTSDNKIYKADDAAGYNLVGVIQEDTSSGDKVTLLYPVAWVDNSSTNAVTNSHIGGVCYVEDETTVASASGAGIGTPLIAGRVLEVDSTKGVLVDFSAKAAVSASAT